MTLRGAVLTVAIIAAAVVTPVLTPTPGANPTVHELARGAKVAIVGVPGLTWTDLAAQPGSTMGVLSVRGERDGATTDIEGWAMLASGARISNDTLARARGRVDTHAILEAQKPTLPGARHLGRIYDAAHAVGSCVASGPSANARLAAAARNGTLDPVNTSNQGALDSACRVAVIEATSSTVLGDARAAASAGRMTIVVGLSDRTKPELHAVMIVPQSTRSSTGRWAESASTRREAYVQLIDVAPTVAQVLGAPVPKDVDGQPITVSGDRVSTDRDAASATDRLRKLNNQATGNYRWTPWTITALLAIGLLAVGLSGRRRPFALRWFGAMPAGCFLLGAQPMRGWVPEIAIAATVAWVIAALARTAHGVAGATMLVLVVDLVLGARWQIDTPLGYSALVAGRFAGIGNLAFGAFAAAVLIAASGTSRRVAAALVILAIVVDGAPMLGADLGGTLALVPAAFVLLGVRGRRLVLGMAVGALVAGGFAALDLLRPRDSRTHLGRFAQRVIDGDAGSVIARKAISSWDLIAHSPLTVLGLVVALVALVYANLSAGDGPQARVIHALSLAGVVGFLLNDSGLAAVVTLVWVAVPLISAATRPPPVSRVRRAVLP